MKVIASLCLLFALTNSTWGQEIAVRTLLSHGHTLSSGQTCTSNEWDEISSRVLSHAFRDLRMDRDLSPSYCRQVCRGFAPGACVGYRRELEGGDMLLVDSDDDDMSHFSEQFRELSSLDDACKAKISEINADLDALSLSLSSDCQAVVGATRDFTCFESLDYEIFKMKLWDANTNTVMDKGFRKRNETFCDSDFVNFEALTGDMVEKVRFRLTGPNDLDIRNSERAPPFMAFGSSGDDIYGKKLEVGSYRLRATPDNDSSKKRLTKFDVVNC